MVKGLLERLGRKGCVPRGRGASCGRASLEPESQSLHFTKSLADWGARYGRRSGGVLSSWTPAVDDLQGDVCFPCAATAPGSRKFVGCWPRSGPPHSPHGTGEWALRWRRAPVPCERPSALGSRDFELTLERTTGTDQADPCARPARTSSRAAVSRGRGFADLTRTLSGPRAIGGPRTQKL